MALCQFSNYHDGGGDEVVVASRRKFQAKRLVFEHKVYSFIALALLAWGDMGVGMMDYLRKEVFLNCLLG